MSAGAGLSRGAMANQPLKAAIIGGGRACENLLTILSQERLNLLNMEVLGVADPNPQAPGIERARQMGIFTTQDFTELYTLAGLNLLIELTGSVAVRERMIRTKPIAISSIDNRGARLLWDLVQIEIEKSQVEHQAEEAIKRERDWFHRILDSLPDQIMVLDRQMRIVAVNQTFSEVSGLDKDTVIGQPCHLVRFGRNEPCASPDLACPFTQVLKTGQTESLLQLRTGSQGCTVYEEVIATPILGEDGQVEHMVEGVRDVTQRVRLESELCQAEQNHRQLMDAAQDIIVIKDMQGRYLYANPATHQFSGLTPEAMRGHTDFELFPPGLAKAMVAQDDLVRLHRTTLCFDEMMRVEGQERRFHTVRYPIFDQRGEMVSVSIMARDVTQEKALQEEVRQSRDYMRAVLTNSSDMIITTDLTGAVVTFNPGGERMLGYTLEEVRGRDIAALWHEPERRRELMRQVRRHGAVNNFPATLVAKDGHQVEISLSLAQLRDGQGQVLGTVGISKDVTEENRLRHQVIENERLAAIGQTVAGLAHCIKNILNGLRGGSYLVDTGLKNSRSELVEEGWQSVKKNIARIGNLSLDMLNYCRERTPELQPCDPGELARAAVEMVAQTARMEGVAMEVEVQPGPPVLLDPGAMNRALVNLLGNAVDACLERDYPPDVKPLVRVLVRRKPGWLELAVADNGVGMPAEVRGNLFKRFYSTKDSRGTGLGLAVTQKIVGEHQGRMEVDSTPGQGSTFTMVLLDQV
ncbi:MAG: PAS domain S-box protein [Pseudomonadota bacterium]